MDIMATEQARKLWGVTPRRVSELCRSGRINGAYKIGTSWVMPVNTEKPKDERVRNGNWINSAKNITTGDIWVQPIDNFLKYFRLCINLAFSTYQEIMRK